MFGRGFYGPYGGFGGNFYSPFMPFGFGGVGYGGGYGGGFGGGFGHCGRGYGSFCRHRGHGGNVGFGNFFPYDYY